MMYSVPYVIVVPCAISCFDWAYHNKVLNKSQGIGSHQLQMEFGNAYLKNSSHDLPSLIDMKCLAIIISYFDTNMFILREIIIGPHEQDMGWLFKLPLSPFTNMV